MANYNLRSTNFSGTGGVNGALIEAWAKFRIDLSKVNSGAGAVAADTLDFADVPAGDRVRAMYGVVVKAAGGTCTADVGDTADADAYFSNARSTALNLNAAVGTRVDLAALYSGTTPNIAAVDGTNGKVYPTGGVLRATINNTNALAIVDLFVLFAKGPQLL